MVLVKIINQNNELLSVHQVLKVFSKLNKILKSKKRAKVDSLQFILDLISLNLKLIEKLILPFNLNKN
jgi:hypothetical protein